jgi:DNA-binding NarL/FixJ family response regulator
MKPPVDDRPLRVGLPRADHQIARSGMDALSQSELDVLKDAADGLTVGETAIRRVKSSATVKGQRAAVLAKLSASNIVHAVAMMSRHDLHSARQLNAPRIIGGPRTDVAGDRDRARRPPES